jgi:hypothetical protein
MSTFALQRRGGGAGSQRAWLALMFLLRGVMRLGFTHSIGQFFISA